MSPSAYLKYDTDVEIIETSNGPEEVSAPAPNKALRAIARLLGKQAAAHVHKYRFEGLGRLELIRLQEEARARSNNCNIDSKNSSNKP